MSQLAWLCHVENFRRHLDSGFITRAQLLTKIKSWDLDTPLLGLDFLEDA